MEYFYRYMCKKYFVLMAGGQLAGSQGNVDSDNRKLPQLVLKSHTPTIKR
jgi:deoxyribodipyrimidine photolyase-like uncharacterized protein